MTNINLLKSKMVAAGDGATTSKLARLLGVSRITAGHKLNGKSKFNQREIKIISDHYNLSPEEVAEIFLN